MWTYIHAYIKQHGKDVNVLIDPKLRIKMWFNNYDNICNSVMLCEAYIYIVVLYTLLHHDRKLDID